jgi:hypothetical protein
MTKCPYPGERPYADPPEEAEQSVIDDDGYRHVIAPAGEAEREYRRKFPDADEEAVAEVAASHARTEGVEQDLRNRADGHFRGVCDHYYEDDAELDRRAADALAASQAEIERLGKHWYDAATQANALRAEVERLKAKCVDIVFHEQATEALRARIAELEKALEKIENSAIVPDCEQSAWIWEVARAALAKDKA